MKRKLRSLVDKGCWISYDRIYAFVSAEHGITELGYHGLQPVSKNSRILVHESGVLTFSVRTGDNEFMLQTNEIDWQPTRTESKTVLPGGSYSLSVAATGRSLIVSCSPSVDSASTLCVRLSKHSAFRAVHGERAWTPFRSRADRVITSFRDRIMLQEWLSRTGLYAGDFLIPEPVRKKIFETSKRSGLATREDLRPEYKNADFAIYDAEGFITFGGEGFSLNETTDAWIFERVIGPEGAAEFTIQFSDKAETSTPRSVKATEIAAASYLTLPGFPNLEEFVSTVPGLVDSCIVRDYGIPRACPGRYYWIWAWDSLVTMQEALRWGDYSNVLRTVRFIEQHRDETGRIPARWTRSLLPLDTPSPGGIEFLQAALVYDASLETDDDNLLRESLPSLIKQFQTQEPLIIKEGLVKGEGFYPDLLAAFGRNEQSAVCMEVGSWYVFCRILENIARHIGDGNLEQRASTAARAISKNFNSHFWDKGTGFWIDSIDSESGTRCGFHPLFALLSLQSPMGLPLIRSHLGEAAAFVGRELLTDHGMRVIPEVETGPSGEAVLDSWYPHWDFYALKLLRRARDAGAIMRWLRRAEETLSKLGYCPEFLSLKGFREEDSHAWKHHGSASNLNCVTAWHRALRESIVGFEFDPGGITHIPLSLPIVNAQMEGITWRGGTWRFESVYNGPHLESLSVDGQAVEGCLKIPSSSHTKEHHVVTARYGNTPLLPCFTEIANARVIGTRRLSDEVEVRVEPMGFVEAVFFSPQPVRLLINDELAAVSWSQDTGYGYAAFAAHSDCTLRLQRGSVS